MRTVMTESIYYYYYYYYYYVKKKSRETRDTQWQ